jgi:hypothetical protein
VIGHVLQRITLERIAALVVVPKWPSQPWWGLLHPLARTVLELGSAVEILITEPEMLRNQPERKLPPGLLLVALLCPATFADTGNV